MPVNFAKQEVALAPKYITEAGYYFTYLSYEGESNNYVFFDDYKVTHTKSRLIQGNEYYPFGMQTENSWTRESETGNRYLANGGTELNATTQLYDLMFRNYDPVLGRMFQIDPVAAKYASLTPYNYSFNNPIGFSDPSGADPDEDAEFYRNQRSLYYFHNGAGAMGYPGLTYDDRDPTRRITAAEYNCASCWRTDGMMGWLTGGGPGLNAGSFAYQDARYKAGLMARAVASALGGADGETYMTVSGGFITGSEFKSTLQLQREWGGEIARNHYGGDGRMSAVDRGMIERARIVQNILIPFAKVALQFLPKSLPSAFGPQRASLLAHTAALTRYYETIEKMVAKLNSAASVQSYGVCAKSVRLAIEAGGIDTNNHPRSAKDFGPSIESWGFSKITTTDYKMGDVVVMNAIKGHPNGHMMMFNGTHWVSDYFQDTSPKVDPTGFWPGGDYRNANPSFSVYRMELNLPPN